MCTMVTYRVVFPVVFLMYTAIGTLALGELLQTLLKACSDLLATNGRIVLVGSSKMLVLHKENIKDMLMHLFILAIFTITSAIGGMGLYCGALDVDTAVENPTLYCQIEGTHDIHAGMYTHVYLHAYIRIV